MTFAATGLLDALPPALREHLLTRAGGNADILRDVDAIGQAVAGRGDDALREFSSKFDGVELDAFEIPRADWSAALARIPADVRDALEAAHANIARYHRAMMPSEAEVEVTPGVHAGRRIVPLGRVGAYVPGGRAAYPSTVLMTVTPAKVAGVGEVIVVTPPDKLGHIPDATLAACAIAGADRVFALGGAHAIFALAHGTETVPRVDKIVGPGNAYVATAKGLVAGRVAIDSPAGPSEVLVLADETASARLIVAELLAQAEHDPRASCIALVTTQALADEVANLVTQSLGTIDRADIVREALSTRGAVLVAPDEDALVAFSEAYAAEHLVIMTRDPRALLARLANYGSAFLGPWSSVAFGDYCSGPNHVLPTGGLARAYNGLGVDDFVRRPTHQHLTREGAQQLADIAARLARFEGLPNHARAVDARRDAS